MPKAPTGIADLDAITRGGLLAGRVPLIVGGPGLREAREDVATPGFLLAMFNCANTLRPEVTAGVSQRSPRVLKHRGAGFAENESPLATGGYRVEIVHAASGGADG